MAKLLHFSIPKQVFYDIPNHQEDHLSCKELLHFAFQAIRAEKNPVLPEVRYISPKLPLHFLESKVLLCQNTAAIPDAPNDTAGSRQAAARPLPTSGISRGQMRLR